MLPALRPTANLIQQDFQLEELPELPNEQALLQFLEEVIEHLLEHQIERLFNILYRLDVDERKVQYALLPYAEQAPAAALAQLVWEREQQKVLARAEYQSPADEDEEVTPW